MISPMTTSRPDQDVSDFAFSVRTTTDAIDSAIDLIGFTVPKYQNLDAGEVQMIDPERGTLSTAETHRAVLTIMSELESALFALTTAKSHLDVAVVNAERMYPKA